MKDLNPISGNAPGLPGIYAIMQMATTDTPIIKLFRRQQALVDAADAYLPTDMTVTDEDMDRLFYNEIRVIEAEMRALPCTGPSDFAAKMIVETARGGIFLCWETSDIWAEARALVAEA